MTEFLIGYCVFCYFVMGVMFWEKKQARRKIKPFLFDGLMVWIASPFMLPAYLGFALSRIVD
jgi:uncharacterized membrane protein SirB2